jgi:hypothetical protein
MRRFRARVESVGLLPSGGEVARITASARDVPHPGQPVLGLRPGRAESTRTPLFPIEITPAGFSCAVPPDQSWRVGHELDLLGPIGSGFRPPAAARRWLLMGIDRGIDPLMPLIRSADGHGASVSLWSETRPLDLSPGVEIATDLGASLDWADYLAVCVTPHGLGELRLLLDPRESSRLPARAEILIMVPMPCGIGGCAACALRARRGWKLCCTDGPVFRSEELAW